MHKGLVQLCLNKIGSIVLDCTVCALTRTGETLMIPPSLDSRSILEMAKASLPFSLELVNTEAELTITSTRCRPAIVSFLLWNGVLNCSKEKTPTIITSPLWKTPLSPSLHWVLARDVEGPLLLGGCGSATTTQPAAPRMLVD
jgi:hypothetical protein